jgi:hypothetical protein
MIKKILFILNPAIYTDSTAISYKKALGADRKSQEKACLL